MSPARTEAGCGATPEQAAQGKHCAAADGEPVRMCVICRRRFPKRELARYTVAPSGELLFDARKTGPGRGWYVCADETCRRKFAAFRPSRRRRG